MYFYLLIFYLLIQNIYKTKTPADAAEKSQEICDGAIQIKYKYLLVIVLMNEHVRIKKNWIFESEWMEESSACLLTHFTRSMIFQGKTIISDYIWIKKLCQTLEAI